MEAASRPRTSEMTFWSRHDPIRQPKGNTDHWAKYRQRTGNVRIRFGSPGPVKNPVQEETYGLRGNPPGSYMTARPRNSFNKDLYNNTYHERAREGFRYWLIERPKPTKSDYKERTGVGLFRPSKYSTSYSYSPVAKSSVSRMYGNRYQAGTYRASNLASWSRS